MCRRTGLVVAYNACAQLWDITANEACAELTGSYTTKAPCAKLPGPSTNFLRVIATTG